MVSAARCGTAGMAGRHTHIDRTQNDRRKVNRKRKAWHGRCRMDSHRITLWLIGDGGGRRAAAAAAQE